MYFRREDIYGCENTRRSFLRI